jgi:hypothetical protein
LKRLGRLKNGLLVLLGGSPLHTNVDGGLSVGIRENPSIPAALTKTAKVNFSVAVLGDSDGGLREDGGLRDPTAKTAIRKSTLAVLGKPQRSCGFEPLPDVKAATSPVCEGSRPLEAAKTPKTAPCLAEEEAECRYRN